MSVTADALNSALLHSLWQDAIVGLLLWGTLIAMRRASANARYIVCCAALGLMAALPVITTLVLSERGYSAQPLMPATLTVEPTVVSTAPDACDTARERTSGLVGASRALGAPRVAVWRPCVLTSTGAGGRSCRRPQTAQRP